MANELKQQKIAVLFGGTSAEREVSLDSGMAVIDALRTQGYDVQGVDTKYEKVELLREKGFDRVFNILHGRGGEDGTLQGLLEQLGIPYTGCGVLASSLTMDKLRTKMLWKGFGLPVAEMVVVYKESVGQLDVDNVVKQLGLPLMVKPSQEGSSVGLSKVNNVSELKRAVEVALGYDDTVLIEAWLSGREFSVPVLNGEVLPAIEIKTTGEFYDYEAKYISNETKYVCPAEMSEEDSLTLKALVKRAYDSVGCRGWSRVDVMTNDKGEFVLVEVNTTPGMTSHSLFPMSAKVVGYSFEQLVERILELSI